MPTPTTSWDETSPAGSDALAQGDNRIREMKTQVREVIDVDHDFPSSGSASDVGQHKRCTFQEQADLGTGAVGTTILGSQTVSGKGELVYTDEDNNDVQITDNGILKMSSGLFNKIWPVGSIYTSVVSTNPNTLFGFGTWTAFGAGRVLVGIDAGQTEFDTVEETGGSKTHTLSTAEMPAHTHDVTVNGSVAAGSGPGSGATQAGETKTSTSTGGGGAHNNLQPYIVVYFWKRTA